MTESTVDPWFECRVFSFFPVLAINRLMLQLPHTLVHSAYCACYIEYRAS